MSKGHRPKRGGGPHGGMMPMEKPKDFKGTFKRLLQYLSPYKYQLVLVVLLAALSTVFSIFTPKIMGKATTKLFEGIMMKQRGIPGAKIDFEYIFKIIITLGWLYVASAAFSYLQQFIMASVSQRLFII